MLALRSHDIELVSIARRGAGDEQFPIADAADPHRMASLIPEIEIADHADAPGIGCEHHERHAIDAVERHRMRAELVVEPLMGAFAKQIEIEIGQDGRKAIGIIEINDLVAEAGPQLVAFRTVRQRAGKQAGLVNARERRGFAVLADRLDIGGLRQERAHDVPVALGMQAEIVERVGMSALDDRIGLGGQFGHEASLVFETIFEASRSAERAATRVGEPVRIRSRRTPFRSGRSPAAVRRLAGSAGHSRGCVMVSR